MKLYVKICIQKGFHVVCAAYNYMLTKGGY